MSTTTREATEHIAQALKLLGFVGDPEMDTTAERFVGFLSDFQPAILPPVQPLDTRSQSPVVIRNLRYHSLCAHHLLPFFGTCTIAYRPAGAIAGLGWFPRVVGALAQRPQLQERLAEQIAEQIHSALAPQSVAVFVSARQMCVEMRGPRAHGAFEVTSVAGEPDDALLRLVQPR